MFVPLPQEVKSEASIRSLPPEIMGEDQSAGSYCRHAHFPRAHVRARVPSRPARKKRVGSAGPDGELWHHRCHRCQVLDHVLEIRDTS